MAATARPAFIQEIEQSEVGVASDFDVDSDVMLMAFGGGRGEVGGIPPFEFFNISSSIPVKKVFIRDQLFTWYHTGVVGAGSSVDEVAEYLRQVVAEQGVSHTVAVGNCGGGWGALMFGSLVGVNEIHAIAPCVFIDRELRQRYDDPRWANAVDRLYRNEGFDPRYVDVMPLVRDAPTATTVDVYNTTVNPRETRHAMHLAQLERVKLHTYHVPGPLIRQLKASGELRTMLERALRVKQQS